jgi:hypothetical protein
MAMEVLSGGGERRKSQQTTGWVKGRWAHRIAGGEASATSWACGR